MGSCVLNIKGKGGQSCNLTIVPVIKGLSNQRDVVREAFSIGPEFVALSISPEELKGLMDYRDGEMDDAIELSDYEEIYALKLSKWGDIEMPPPCYTEALKISTQKKLKIGAIDMDEQTFTNAYCAYVSGVALVRHSLRKSLVKRAAFDAETPEEFVRLWDRRMNRIGGYRKLENRREEFMAGALSKACMKFNRVLAFIELERAGGVVLRLRERGIGRDRT